MVEHPFAATRALMKKNDADGSRFSRLNEQQKWEWHSDVYAFNRIMRGLEGSPADPDGNWRNEHMISICERYYNAIIEDRKKGAIQQKRSEDLQREGRDLVNDWARRKGYADIDAYALATGVPLLPTDGFETYAYEIARQEIVAEELERRRKAEILRGMKHHPRDVRSTQSLDAVKEQLGLKVEKPPYSPSPEYMAASRRRLGIEEPEGRQQFGIEE